MFFRACSSVCIQYFLRCYMGVVCTDQCVICWTDVKQALEGVGLMTRDDNTGLTSLEKGVCVHLRVCVCVHACVYVCVCVCIYVFMCFCYKEMCFQRACLSSCVSVCVWCVVMAKRFQLHRSA